MSWYEPQSKWDVRRMRDSPMQTSVSRLDRWPWRGLNFSRKLSWDKWLEDDVANLNWAIALTIWKFHHRTLLSLNYSKNGFPAILNYREIQNKHPHFRMLILASWRNLTKITHWRNYCLVSWMMQICKLYVKYYLESNSKRSHSWWAMTFWLCFQLCVFLDIFAFVSSKCLFICIYVHELPVCLCQRKSEEVITNPGNADGCEC